jgi:hypothetical protein
LLRSSCGLCPTATKENNLVRNFGSDFNEFKGEHSANTAN